MAEIGFTKQQVEQLRDELEHCSNPLFIYDDDNDGLSAYLLLYRYKREGRSIILKSQPNLDLKFLSLVEDQQPDKIFVLDVPQIDQEFLDAVNVPVIWIDHHGPYERNGVKYYNPRMRGDEYNAPTSYLCYQIVEQDLWLALIGIIGDWFYPDIAKDFSKEHSDLLPAHISSPPDALFGSKIGVLSHAFNFILKGDMQEVTKYIKALTTIEDPYEILDQKTECGAFIYKKYQKYYEEYSSLLKEAMQSVAKSPLVVFIYGEDKTAFTTELSNEILYRYPEKVIIVGREKDGMLKCSLRSGKNHIVRDMLQQALVGVQGHGGGHEHACGAGVNKDDWERFLGSFKEQLRIDQ
ncbi:hypothetical protein H6504_02670 [Candidatus Woesearchaeota archaeon]|nr:hypothetical protein [Candidatus Woesearchaeota archaeon]